MRRSRERRTELEGHGICGTAGRGEIGGETRDGMPKGFRLRKPLPPEVDSFPIEAEDGGVRGGMSRLKSQTGAQRASSQRRASIGLDCIQVNTTRTLRRWRRIPVKCNG